MNGGPRRCFALAAPVALLLAVFCCTHVGAAEQGVAVRVPATAEVPWRGLMAASSTDGRAGAMMYPAPNLAGFLVAILAHGLVVEGTRNAERTQQEKAADLVLEPYRPLLGGWTQQALLEAALVQLQRPAARLLPEGSTAAPGEWIVDLVPGFAIAQDHATLVLDALVRIQRPGADGKTETIIRVLSAPLPATVAAHAEPAAPASAPGTAASAVSAVAMPAAGAPSAAPPAFQPHWSADNGRALKAETAAMVAHAIDAVLAQLPGPASAPSADLPFRTHRYLMGSVEAMERAQLLARGCDRVLLRTLRGHLLSAAAVQQSTARTAPCAPGYRIEHAPVKPAT